RDPRVHGGRRAGRADGIRARRLRHRPPRRARRRPARRRAVRRPRPRRRGMSADLSLYLVTDAGLCGARGVVATVREAVAGGATVVQLREKNATDAEAADLLVQLSRVIDGRALLIVNDR